MNKRGQVTIFIIIAIVILAVIAMIFIFRNQLGIFTPKSDPVYLFVKDCIEETGKDAISYVINNGGYLYPISLSTSSGIPYYYYNNKSYLPTKERIEQEISSYIEKTLSYCTEDFSNFSGLNISEGEIVASTTIDDNDVIFNVKYPVTVKKGESVSRFENFNDIKVILGVGALYNSIRNMIQKQAGSNSICLSCLSEIADSGEFTVDMTNTDEGIIFDLKDNNSRIKDAPLEWRFANRY